MDSFYDWFDEAEQTLKRTFVYVKDTAQNLISSAWNSLAQTANYIKNEAVEPAIRTADYVLYGIRNSGENLLNDISNRLDGLKDFIYGLPNELEKRVKTAAETVAKAVSDKVEDIRISFEAMLGNLKTDLSNTLKGLSNAFKEITKDLTGEFKNMIGFLSDRFSDIRSWIEQGYNDVIKQFELKIKAITEGIGDMVSVLRDKFAEFTDNLKNGLNELLNGIDQTLNSIFNPLVQTIGEIGQKLIDALTFDTDRAIEFMLDMQAKLQKKMREEFLRKIGEQI